MADNPGSKEAIANGCTCPVLDNSNGKGIGDGQFWISGDCPVHAEPSPELGEKKGGSND